MSTIHDDLVKESQDADRRGNGWTSDVCKRAVEEIERLTKQLATKTGDCGDDKAWDKVWQTVHPGDTSWEFPGQVIREVKAEIEQLTNCILEAEDVAEEAGRPEGERLAKSIQALAAERDEREDVARRLLDSAEHGGDSREWWEERHPWLKEREGEA